VDVEPEHVAGAMQCPAPVDAALLVQGLIGRDGQDPHVSKAMRQHGHRRYMEIAVPNIYLRDQPPAS